MIERYFTKPQTVDRIRSSWLGEAIERYVTWLAEHGYQARSVYHRVPLLLRFAAFAHQRGATQIPAAADQVDSFIQRQLAHRIRRSPSTIAKQQYVRDTRSRIQHFLRVVRMDGVPPGSNAARPLAHWAPHFFAHLHDERGLSPATVDEKTAVINRIQKVLEDANIKLGAVASDVVGVSGRAMLQAIVAGETDPQQLAELAKRRLRSKIPALRQALDGRVTAHHRFLLRTLFGHLEFLEQQIRDLDHRIEEAVGPFARQIDRLMTTSGVQRRTAENVLAELGPDMTVFPSASHLASWTALCPGNNQTGGKHRSGTTRKGNPWLRRTLTQAAWAAARTRNSYSAAQYRRLAGRRGQKRAIVAVAHSLLVAFYFILRDDVPYQDLGADHLDRLTPARLTRSLVKRLERLGYNVTLKALEPAA